MTSCPRLLLVALAGVFIAHAVLAQSAAPASAPGATSTGPRALTPDERREGGAMPGDLRPVDPVVPQLRVPLGKPAPASSSASAAVGVDDSIAACKARLSKAARSDCLRHLRPPKKMP